MNSLLYKIGAVILAVCSFIAYTPAELQGQVPALFPEQYRGWLALIFGIAAYVAHNYGASRWTESELKKLIAPKFPADHPVLQTPQKQFTHTRYCHLLVFAALALAMSGCSITKGLANKSNNGSLSGTGLYYDSTTGKMGAGILHASLLTHKDGAPAQVSIQNNYSSVPFDSSLSSSTVSTNFGGAVSNFSVTYSGTTATVQFSEQPK